ncbi:MAG: hypothetical protein ABI759_07605 [Candidatus Solibacter sp.]
MLRLVLAGWLACLSTSMLPAQTARKSASAVPADETAYQRALAVAEPAAQLAAILQFFTNYPNSRSVPMMVGRAFAAATQGRAPNAQRSVALAENVARRLAKASPMARSEAARAIAQGLLARNFAAEAEAYARQATLDLNLEDHVARERQRYRQRVDLSTARDPEYKALPFYVEEARERYRVQEAGAWATLARALMKQGRDAEARQALVKSLAAARTADGASAYAELAAKEGDTNTVLDALGTAILTGKADQGMLDRFQTAYRGAGMRMEAERWLDSRYRRESRNPLPISKYAGPTASPRRAVLVEIVTGAACEACVAVDLAADALLQRYSRQDVVLLAHHMHAPSADPLVSPAAEARTRFYAASGTPTVILDGETIEPGEGMGSVARPVFDAVDAAIQKRLAVPPEARIDLKAWWSGTDLRVEAGIEGIADAPGLQAKVFLVETEVSYSGENGFRLHPMVVRSDAGFALKGATRVAAAFAVGELPGELRKSMESHLDGMRARFPGGTFELREERYQVDRKSLGVVAVVQDEATKRVLQTSFLRVE